ncbi:DUF6318 family protein [Nocardioides scoriae]|uniref:DUF6318 family protein n=1 Tax=Nocardioides scoriae TaxID=642780 RepID=UPI0012FC9644|nr:DUF6318 family protein [Nocardioides scoriae]
MVTSVTSVVSLAVLAGCGGSPPEAAPAPTPSPPTETATPEPAAPTPPAGLSTKSESGAKATVAYFLASMAFAGDSGDVSNFRQTFTDECTKCEAIARGIERTYKSGGYIRGGAWKPSYLKFYSIQGDIAYIDAGVAYSPQEYKPKAGSPTQKAPGGQRVLKAFQLRWIAGEWRVGALDPEA